MSINKETKALSKRNANDDLIRIIAAILVIMIHTKGKPWEGHVVINGIFTTIISVCNGLFFMLSGKYNLKIRFNSVSDYLDFYKKRFWSIIIPFAVVSVGWAYWHMYENEMNFSFILFIKVFIFDIVSGNANTYLWFMYTLIPLLLATPFLSKMLNAMKNWELHVLAGIGLSFHFFVINICADFGIGYYGGYFFIWGWLYYFFLGYYLDRVSNCKMDFNLFWIGIIGLIVNVIGIDYYSSNYFQATDYSVPFMMFVISVYILFGKWIKIYNKTLKLELFKCGRCTYWIYLVHYYIKNQITQSAIGINSGVVAYVMKVIVTFVLSLLAASIFNIAGYFCNKMKEYVCKTSKSFYSNLKAK